MEWMETVKARLDIYGIKYMVNPEYPGILVVADGMWRVARTFSRTRKGTSTYMVGYMRGKNKGMKRVWIADPYNAVEYIADRV